MQTIVDILYTFSYVIAGIIVLMGATDLLGVLKMLDYPSIFQWVGLLLVLALCVELVKLWVKSL